MGFGWVRVRVIGRGEGDRFGLHLLALLEREHLVLLVHLLRRVVREHLVRRRDGVGARIGLGSGLDSG